MTTANLGDLIRNAKAKDFTPVPVGLHEVTVESAEFKFTKAGDPMYVAVLVIDEGQPHAGRKLWRNFAITEKSVGIVVAQLGILGVDQETLASSIDGDPSIVCGMLVDAQCIVRVKHREWDGKVQSDVDKILPRPEATAAVNPLADLRPSAGIQQAARPARPF